jgi:hypothetical protein
MTPADLRACLLRLLAALEGRALAGLGPEARAAVCAMQVRLILMRLGYKETAEDGPATSSSVHRDQGRLRFSQHP